jgi:hypothetical protein
MRWSHLIFIVFSWKLALVRTSVEKNRISPSLKKSRTSSSNFVKHID